MTIEKQFVRIAEIAQELGKELEEITLPNGKQVKSIVWRPEDLVEVFRHVAEKGFVIGQHVVIDGAGPQWLVQTIMHACHPAAVSTGWHGLAGLRE